MACMEDNIVPLKNTYCTSLPCISRQGETLTTNDKDLSTTAPGT